MEAGAVWPDQLIDELVAKLRLHSRNAPRRIIAMKAKTNSSEKNIFPPNMFCKHAREPRSTLPGISKKMISGLPEFHPATPLPRISYLAKTVAQES